MVSASRKGNTVYVHVTNTDIESDTVIDIDLGGARAKGTTCHRISPDKLDDAIDSTNLEVFAVKQSAVPSLAGIAVPKASVSAYVIELAE